MPNSRNSNRSKLKKSNSPFYVYVKGDWWSMTDEQRANQIAAILARDPVDWLSEPYISMIADCRACDPINWGKVCISAKYFLKNLESALNAHDRENPIEDRRPKWLTTDEEQDRQQDTGDLPIFPVVESARALKQIQTPPPKEPIPGLLRAGLNVLAAGKGVGKSYLALAFGVGIAETGRVLDHEFKGGGIDVEIGAVLYIANESDRVEMKDRLTVLTDSDEWPERLDISYGSKRLDQGLLDDIDEWLVSHPDASLVIIDILANIRAPVKHNRDSYRGDIQEMAALHKLGLKHDVAILAVSHTKKGEAQDWVNKFMGWEIGSAGVCLMLERKWGDNEGSLELQGRGLAPSKWKLGFDSGTWFVVGKGKEFFSSEASQRVIEILRRAGKPVYYKSIRDDLEKSGPATKVLLGRMVNKKLILRTGSGYYALATPPSDVSIVTPVTNVTSIENQSLISNTSLLPEDSDTNTQALLPSKITPVTYSNKQPVTDNPLNNKGSNTGNIYIEKDHCPSCKKRDCIVKDSQGLFCFRCGTRIGGQ